MSYRLRTESFNRARVSALSLALFPWGGRYAARTINFGQDVSTIRMFSCIIVDVAPRVFLAYMNMPRPALGSAQDDTTS